MNLVAPISAVVVGATFVAAGVLKVSGWQRWLSESSGMKTPRPIAVALPGVEIVLGALLMAQVARPVTGGLAALVLLGFTMAILVRLADGERPPCACFGSWSARPLGPRHVVRNVVLIVVAMMAALL